MRKKMDLKYLILIIAFATIEINFTESRHSERRKSKNDKSIYSQFINICDIEDRVSKVHCYCESIKINTATKAHCWVFNGGIEEDDPFWSNFYSQQRIERLAFNVRFDGGLTYIPAKVIVRLEHLQFLNIQYANITAIPAFAFTNSTTLKEINLPKNKIIKLEPMSFAHLTMLTNVSLRENMITELKRDVFFDLPNLQKLQLSKNVIEVLHDGCFKHLNNLVKLDLDGNLMTVLIRENFEGLSNLITLDMKNNKLTMIGDLVFAELWNLEELYLDGNEIEFISERGLASLSQLRKLSLADNKLKTLGDGVLDEMQKLIVLDLRNNKLETLKQETISNILQNMKSSYALISLVGNKLTCDCRLSWLHQLQNDTKSKRVKTSIQRLNCYIDNKLRSKLDNKISKDINEIPTGDKMKSNDKVYDEIDEYDDEKSYDEMQDLELGDGREYRKKLLEIPTEMLPCPFRQHITTPFPPTQNEVRAYQGSFGVRNINSSVNLILVFLTIMVLSAC